MGKPPAEYETVTDRNGISIPKIDNRIKVADCVECGSLMTRELLRMLSGKNIPALVKNIWRERLRYFGLPAGEGRFICHKCSDIKSSKPCKLRNS